MANIIADRAPLNAPRSGSSYFSRPGYVHRELQTVDGWWEGVRTEDGRRLIVGDNVEPTPAYTAAYEARAQVSRDREAADASQATKREQAKAILNQDPAGMTEAQFRRFVFRALKHLLKGAE